MPVLLLPTHAEQCRQKENNPDTAGLQEENLPFKDHLEKALNETLKEIEDISDPQLIVKIYAQRLMRGRALDMDERTESYEGDTFEIFVDRTSVLNDGATELSQEGDFSVPIEVTFIGEEAQDLGGPRREFLSMCLQEIKERFICEGRLVTEDDLGKETFLMAEEAHLFRVAGLLVGLSLLQGGPMPGMFADPEFVLKPEGPVETQFVDGMDVLGIIKLAKQKPTLVSLFKETTEKLTYGTLTRMLVPRFSERGTNRRAAEGTAYRYFIDYIKEVAAHRRGPVQLADILKFVTGSENEPTIGFANCPTIEFVHTDSPLPTSRTCTCVLMLPVNITVQREKLFDLMDYAFLNTYFGVV